MKNESVDYYKEALKQVAFPSYENFSDVNEGFQCNSRK